MSVKISEILRNNVREMLARDEVVASMTVRLVRSVEIARMGARYVSTGTDLGFLLAACAAKAKEVADMAAGRN
jgi:hypothetical protein